MNRRDEYWTLIEELGQEPPELEASVSRAVRRAKTRRWRRPLGLLGSLAGVCAAFVLMVNASPAFAISCGNIPLLKELAASVSWSPSLRAAIEHDFIQYVGQSQTVDGLTVSLEYLIADQQQMVVFYTVPEGQEDYSVSCNLKDRDGNKLMGYSTTSGSSHETLKQFTIHFTDLTPPDTLILELELVEWGSQTGDRQRYAPFTFTIRLDPAKMARTTTLPVGKWIELNGQHLLVDRLELAPTRTALYLDDDPDNTAWLYSLDFYFTDRDGQRYDHLDSSVAAVGREESPGSYTYYHQSLYFAPVEGGVTLHITGALWTDKQASSIRVDLTDGSADWMPAYMLSIVSTKERFTDWGVQKVLEITTSTPRVPFGRYRDPDGGEYQLYSHGFSSAQYENGQMAPPYRHSCILKDYSWDSVELELEYTHVTQLDTPLALSIS